MNQKHNILVICSDQHHPRMSGFRGHDIVQTPNLDRLAAEGVDFRRSYCSSPICTPSRMSFITGKYVHQIDNWTIGFPLDRDEMTWARRLDLAGIPSTMLGKMDFCGEYQDGGFTHHRIIRRRAAWKEIPRLTPWPARLEGYVRPDKRRHLLESGTRPYETVSNGGFSDEKDNRIGNYDHDRIITQWALEYLREKGAGTSPPPWALYVGFLLPHWPFRIPEQYFNLYYPDNIHFPVDARFPNMNLHPALCHFQKALGLGEVTEEMLRTTIAAYYGMVTCLDEMIGQILAELQKQGFADNTFVIYTSDHGESLGEHGLFYKQCSYEGSVGVPLVLRGPGVPKGKAIDAPVSLIDMYPTVMEVAGLQPEADLPGRSWLPLARGEQQDRPDYAFSEFHANFLEEDWYMLVRGDFKYTYYTHQRPSLFNTREDPHECNDLALAPGYKGVLEQFETLLRNILDPEAVSLRARKDLGLIGSDGSGLSL